MSVEILPKIDGLHGWSYRKFNAISAEDLVKYQNSSTLSNRLKEVDLEIDSLLSPLRELIEWRLLENYLEHAYFVERSLDKQLGSESLYVIVPVKSGFLSAELSSSVLPLDWIFKLPSFLRNPFSSFSLLGINRRNPYIEIPSVSVLRSFKTSLIDYVHGKRVKKATKVFGARWDFDLSILANDDDKNWSLFADFSDCSEGSIWVSFNRDFSDIRLLTHSHEAYIRMTAHYLGGSVEPFDFHPYAEKKSIW